MINSKKPKKVRRRDVQIIKALELWFIRHKKQGRAGIAKRFIEIVNHIAGMDLAAGSDKAVSLKLNVNENSDLVIEPERIATKTAKSVIEPERIATKTAKSVVEPERIAIKSKNTWHKKNWKRR